MAIRRTTTKVHLYFRPQDAAVVSSLCAEGMIDKALIAYTIYNPNVTEMDVYVERDARGIGWDIRVRGVERNTAIA